MFRTKNTSLSPNLGALSVSSLGGSTTGTVDDDMIDQTAELYQRLHDLEQLTNTFLNERFLYIKLC